MTYLSFSKHLKIVFLTPCIILSACENSLLNDKKGGLNIIHSDRSQLELDLEHAKDVTLKTGQPATIRMVPHNDLKQVKNDQFYAKQLIKEKYGNSAIISFEEVF